MLYFVFIVTNHTNSVFYTGVACALDRATVHKALETEYGPTKPLHKVVYYEEHSSVLHAIIRENQIKNYSRNRKSQLIRFMNREWLDLTQEKGATASVVSNKLNSLTLHATADL